MMTFLSKLWHPKCCECGRRTRENTQWLTGCRSLWVCPLCFELFEYTGYLIIPTPRI